MDSDLRFAILIDADNISDKYIKVILDETANKCLPLSGADTKRIPCAPENGNPFPVLLRLHRAEKIFSKIFSFFALKTISVSFN